MKKVLIFYGSFGGGHLSAAQAIERELLKNDEIEVEMIDALGYVNKGINKISTKTYEGIAKKTPWFMGKLYFGANKSMFSHMLYSTSSLVYKKIEGIIKEMNPDLIVCTHPFAVQVCTYLKSKGKIDNKVAVVMTDYEIHAQWYTKPENLDKFYVGSTKMEDDLILKGIDISKIRVTGIPVKEEFSKKYDKKEICESLRLDENKKIFLFFGGGEFGLTQKLLYKTLKKSIEIFHDAQFVIISGKNAKLYKQMVDLKNKNKDVNIKVIEYTKRIPEIMSVATAVFSKPGGLTTTEAMVSGLPFIVIGPLPGQEYANTKYILESDAGALISEENRIEHTLVKFKEDETLFAIKGKNAKKASKPDATKRIVEDIYKMI